MAILKVVKYFSELKYLSISNLAIWRRMNL